MPKFLSDNWQYLTGLAAAVWIVWSFLDQRTSEAAWKRTEFLFEQARYVDTDPELSEVLRIVEGRNSRVSLADIVSDSSSVSPEDRLRYLHALDKLLNAFDRLYYAVHTAKTLEKNEIQIFGWYLDRIAEEPLARRYCEENGFGDVLRLASLNNPQLPMPAASRTAPGRGTA